LENVLLAAGVKGLVGMARLRRYNAIMSAGAPKRQLRKPGVRHHSSLHICATETTGLLVIAVLILILTLARYWHAVHWSLR